MSTQVLPGALRAAATVRVSRILGRSRRVFEYDARFPDGRVELNVDADAVLQSGRYPAEARTTLLAAEAACPEIGTGQWVEHEPGGLIEDTSRAVGTSGGGHRKPGPATTEAPDQPVTFARALWKDPRPMLLEVVRAIFELAYGQHLVRDGATIVWRFAGLALFVFGLLHVASYAMSFVPGVLERAHWSRTWPRRIARAVLKYAWIVAGFGWAVARYVWN